MMMALVVRPLILVCVLCALSYQDDSITIDCKDKLPHYRVEGVKIPPQTLKSPYEIIVNKNEYGPGDEIAVRIRGPHFQGFLIQAHGEDHVTHGQFKLAEKTKYVKCSDNKKATVTHTIEFSQIHDHQNQDFHAEEDNPLEEKHKNNTHHHNVEQDIHHNNTDHHDAEQDIHHNNIDHHDAEQDMHHNNTDHHDDEQDIHHNNTDYHDAEQDMHHNNTDHHDAEQDIHHNNTDHHDAEQDMHHNNTDHHDDEQDIHHNNTDHHDAEQDIHHNNTDYHDAEQDIHHNTDHHDDEKDIHHNTHHHDNEKDIHQNTDHHGAEQDIHHYNTRDHYDTRDHYNTRDHDAEDLKHHKKAHLDAPDREIVLVWKPDGTRENIRFEATVAQYESVFWVNITSKEIKFTSSSTQVTPALSLLLLTITGIMY